MKIAIIGAGISGLSCALECEKLGVIADVYERDYTLGWRWNSINFWPNALLRGMGDPLDHLKKEYDVDLTPLNACKTIIMKSPNQEVKVRGKLGYFFTRGKGVESKENFLLRKLSRSTAIHYNSLMDYKELSSKYDYVVVATGIDSEARELKVWKDEGVMQVYGGVALGSFHDETALLYFNTEYAGTGYARITPFSPTQAIVGLYNNKNNGFDMNKLFAKFLDYENLNFEFLYHLTPPPFTTGRVKKFQVDNILLVGRSAGLTDRLIGVGGPEAIISGVLAARAMIQKKDYNRMVKPIQNHVENVSAFRKIIKDYSNDDFDRLLSIIGAPLIKQAAYNVPINYTDFLGRILRVVKK